MYGDIPWGDRGRPTKFSGAPRSLIDAGGELLRMDGLTAEGAALVRARRGPAAVCLRGHLALVDRTRRDEEGKHLLYAFLTAESNELVRPIHAKAMPAMLTLPEEHATWFSATGTRLDRGAAIVAQHRLAIPLQMFAEAEKHARKRLAQEPVDRFAALDQWQIAQGLAGTPDGSVFDASDEFGKALAIAVPVALAPFDKTIQVSDRRADVDLIRRLRDGLALTPADRSLPAREAQAIGDTIDLLAVGGRCRGRLDLGQAGKSEARFRAHAAALC
jgi:hypothetical protein